MCYIGHMRRFEDNLRELALSCSHVGPGDRTQVISLGSRHLYYLSQFAGPTSSLCKMIILGVCSSTEERTYMYPVSCLSVPSFDLSTGTRSSSPVHEVHEHLGVLLVLLHLHCVCQDHVQVEHEVLNLEQVNVQGSARAMGSG